MSNDAISSTYSCAPRLGCPWLGVSLPRPVGGSGSLVLGLRLADGNVLRCSGGGRDGRISRALSVIRSTPCGPFSDHYRHVARGPHSLLWIRPRANTFVGSIGEARSSLHAGIHA